MLKNCLLATLVLIGCFTGCGKEDLPTAGGDRIKTIVRYMNGYSESATFFSYDQQGRLVTIRDSVAGGLLHQNLEYDATGRLVKLAYPPYTHHFYYDQDNRIVKKLFVSQLAGAQAFKNTYAYDTQGRLVADSSFNEESGPLQNYRTFTYDGAGNVIEKKNFDANHTFTGSEVYAYDRNPNYLQPAHYFSYGGEYALSKNNRIASPNTQGTVQHDYYSNGLPRKTTYTSGDGRFAVHEYYYE